MKKQLLLMVCLLGGLSFLTAQSTLNSSAFNLQPGDSVLSISFMDSVTSPGPAGANQTWDFSFLQERGRSSAVIKAASTSPLASQFPNADIAGLEFTGGIDSANVDQFFSSDANAFTFWGFSSQVTNMGVTSTQTIAYSDPEIILSFPLMFGDSITDQFYGEYDAGGGFTTARKGGNYHTYDGYGTLMMPNGATYPDVIRVKLVQTYKDSSLSPTFPFVTDYESENVYFFSLGAKLPHLQYNKFTTTFPPNPPTTVHFIKAYTGSETVGRAKFLAPDALTLSPNPVQGLAELEIQSTRVENLSVSILSLTGQEVAQPYQGKSLAASTSLPIHTQGLAKGFYIVKVELGEKIGFVKMQVE